MPQKLHNTQHTAYTSYAVPPKSYHEECN